MAKIINLDRLSRFKDRLLNGPIATKMPLPTNTGTQDQILRSDGNGGSVWGSAATASEISGAVEDWMDNHISQNNTVALDDSLTQTGAAAQAKAAGDMIKVSTSQPSETTNKLWIKDGGENEYTVPTMDDHNELKSALYENSISANDLSSNYIQYYYINIPTNAQEGDLIDLTPVSSNTFKYQIITCSEGDKYSISGRGTSNFRGYAFVDTDNKLVSKGGTIYDTVFTAPSSGKLILNANKSYDYSAYQGVWLSHTVEEGFNEVNTKLDVVNGNIAYDESIICSLESRNYTVIKTNEIIELGNLSIGDTANLTPTTGTNFGYLIIECEQGEEFVITANSGTGHLPWACLDASNTVKSIASSASVTRQRITTPETTKKIVITLNANSPQLIIRGAGRVEKLEGSYRPFTQPVVKGVITTNGAETTASSYRRTPDAFLLKAGQKLKMTMSCGTANAALSEWTSANVFIQTLINGAGETTYTYTAERDMYVKYCYNNSNGFTGEIADPTSFDNAKENEKIVTGVSQIPYEWERVLNAVCCIGDSLTKGAYYVNGHDGSSIAQNYPYFFSKQTGLTVQNEGVSGSSPSSRWTYFSTFDFTPYNAFFIWWGTNGGLTDTLQTDGVIDENGDLIADFTTYADTNTGDYCKVIGKIISQVPHAKIFLATIFTTSASGGASATNAVIEKIAALYPYNVMGIVDCNDGTLYTLASKKLTPSWVHIDNATHFSMVGNYYLAVHWIKAVRAIIAANPAKFEDIMEDIIGS